MYNFLFWMLYQKNIKNGPTVARYNGAIVVAANIGIEILLLFDVIRKYFFDFYIKYKTGDINKFTAWIFIIGMMMGAYLYYTPARIERILEKRKDQYPFTSNNIVKALSIFFIPLVLLFIVVYYTDSKIFENS
jgi:hypothetical protein